MRITIPLFFPLIPSPAPLKPGTRNLKPSHAFSLIEPNLPPPPHPSSSGLSRGSPRNGFSLVELSIVLVILGLLTGGILAGQSLIRAAELRSVTADYQRLTSASMTFRDRYMGLPGDMPNATRFWGIRAGTGSDVTCHQTINNYTGTCNGDGNGRADAISGDATYGERFLFAQHLALAGLIEGSYTGASTSATSGVYLRGTNVIPARIDNNFWYPYYMGVVTGSTEWYDNSVASEIINLRSGLAAEELWNLDTKLDDGRPAYGRVFAYKSTGTWSPGCTTTPISSTAEYNLTNTDKNACPFAARLW